MSLADGKFACAAIGGFNRESGQAQTNALLAWAILANKGWTLQAFCGYWGNVGNESVYNPWRWQSDIILASTSSLIWTQQGNAYGLGQWDPAGKYIGGGRDYDGYGPNFSDKPGSYYDGWAQLDFMNSDYAQWYDGAWNMTFDQYKHSTADPRDLARIFFDSWERGTWNEGRKDDAAYWWNFITNGEPIGPDQPTPDPPPLPPGPSGLPTKSKFIFYLKPYWKRPYWRGL